MDPDDGPESMPRRKIVPQPIDPEENAQRNKWIQKNSSFNGPQFEEISEQLGFLSIATGTDIRYIGPASGWFFTEYILANLGKQIQSNGINSYPAINDSYSFPMEQLEVTPRGLHSSESHARLLAKEYFETVHYSIHFHTNQNV
ncbi:hypothetical protein ZTR_10328 [Talaromyces verruculosus]|nr:hypothetical protein ZTR_10328 [Talaromyces verruculosus]